ncbi:uncharacterized protein LOC125661662 isoform X2 [Ostrea edulis]|uniref:uncharacterized protein LOC125661662 isoform X2 n=1 Tax=Ostrea edulis TaxID=37623 RepID=UPI0024AF69B2|nr:uncharacterized protein LOC125661662 isoform X2 [Ostrea edulis]
MNFNFADIMDRQQEQVTSIKELKDTQHEQERRITGIESEHRELEKKVQSSKEHLTQEGINILENTEAVLLAHKSRPVYTKTSAVDVTIEKLKDDHIAILTGKGGTGKTTTAYQVMCEMSGDSLESPYIPVLVKYPEEWNKAINPKHRYVVYIDDFLGYTNLDVGAVEKWKNQLDVIFSCAKTGNVVTMLGMRQNVLEEARKFCVHEILQEEKCIDFSSKYTITEEEKEYMLRAFEEHYTFKASDLCGENFTEFARKNGEDAIYTLTDHDRRVMKSANPYFGFPLTCCQFFSRREFFQLGTSYFKHPNEKLLSAIESMRKSKLLPEKMKYCVLTYVFLLGNIDTKNLREDVFKDVFEKVRISEDINDADISDAIEDLVGVYLSAETTKTEVYKFSHETVLESVLISFGKLAPEIVIKQCRKWQLDELIRTQNYEPKPGEVVLKIARRYYGDLAQKLLHEDPAYNLLQAGEGVMMVAMDILRHPLSDDVEFVSVLLGSDASEKMSEILSEIWKMLRYSDKENDRQDILLCELLDRYGPHTDPGVQVTHDSNHGNVETTEPLSEEPGTSTQPSGVIGLFKTQMTQMLSMLLTTSQTQTPPTAPIPQVPIEQVEVPQKPIFVISVEEFKEFLFLNFSNGTGKCYLLSIMKYFRKFSSLHYLLTDHGVGPLGLSLLHCCVLHGWEDLVDLILEFHTPTKTKWKFWSCSHLAAYAGRLSLLEKFVRLGQDLSERTGDGYSVLQTAILGLRCGPGAVYYPSSSIDTGFQFQLLLPFPELADFTKVITFLLQSGEHIDRNVADPVDNFGNNIVHYLAIHDYKDILNLFLDLNKDIVFHRGNTELPTTLHVAVYLGRPELVKALWEAGVRPRDSDLSLQDTLDSGEKLCGKRVAYTIFQKDSGHNENDDFAAGMANILERWETSNDAETMSKLNSEVMEIFNSMKDLSKQDEKSEKNEQKSIVEDLQDSPTFCWSDGETDIPSIKLKTIKNLSVTFGSINDFKQISDSLKSAQN